MIKNLVSLTSRWCAVVLGMVCLAPGGAQAQFPDKFENLQVLPADISKQELLANMRSFAIGLGVRCQFCHVGEEGLPLSEFDFVSDEKPTKGTARIMISMRNEINQNFLPQLGERRDASLFVQCATCHHGQSKPQTLQQVLMKTIVAEGSDAGIAKYRDLKKQHFGAATYDFREQTLNSLGYQLLQAGKISEAIAIFALNVEVFPESSNAYDSLGEAYAKAGEKANAIAHYRRALELNPDNDNAAKMLKQLEQE